jgi:hypothetical protein
MGTGRGRHGAELVVNNEAKTPADKKEAHGGADDMGRNVDRQKSRGVAPTGQTGMMWPNKASGSVTS